uniref:SecY-independent transporter protein n=1 Tax=Mastocarpus papillatus TaxID=31436 RepID=A0A342RZ79_9FLOR|nr:SecY-independent transporter protein [Mastocarpus papillatus]AOL58025.1 SecY-independent transporter protein [Mastocarpus papillatus]
MLGSNPNTLKINLDKINFLLYSYSIELLYRLSYIVISFIFCIIITFLNVQTLLLVETYPFLQFLSKKFIVTGTTDLIDVVWVLVFSTSLLSSFPLFFYQLIQFSKNSWYIYQISFSLKLLISSLTVYLVSLVFCYTTFLPVVLEFLAQWETKQTGSILNIKIEFRILSYIRWILSFRYVFSFSILTVFLWVTFIYLLLNPIIAYRTVKSRRKLFVFLTIFSFFLLIPPNVFLQFFIISNAFIFYEVLFFFFCYKTYNT